MNPNIKIATTKYLYLEAQKDPELMKYLPDFKGKRVPSRKYMLDIINTVNRRQAENI